MVTVSVAFLSCIFTCPAIFTTTGCPCSFVCLSLIMQRAIWTPGSWGWFTFTRCSPRWIGIVLNVSVPVLRTPFCYLSSGLYCSHSTHCTRSLLFKLLSYLLVRVVLLTFPSPLLCFLQHYYNSCLSLSQLTVCSFSPPIFLYLKLLSSVSPLTLTILS